MSKFSNVSVEQLITPTERKDALKVRIAVFVDEQKYSMESELDSYDDVSEHWAAYCDETNEDGSIRKHVPVGTIRLIPQPQHVAKLGRLAVLSSARGLHIGQKLVKSFIQHCKDNGFHSIVLHSQYPRRGFYAKLGFVIEEGDEIFDEDGTPHIRMWLRNI
ncbi:acyl-CoA N-acyltransferase [Mucor mucedo]|uniref:acyl-CoA N-acyltransferase n=1 Tax=Mucor mucedo TaxID=29922 RepID=UPI00221E4F6F|nr:acyl-CoA N-acyltransferase [Mucor mucedo]KAI7889088.1 acyl-CoA N-acyltransferase [Mucor mucedo]